MQLGFLTLASKWISGCIHQFYLLPFIQLPETLLMKLIPENIHVGINLYRNISTIRRPFTLSEYPIQSFGPVWFFSFDWFLLAVGFVADMASSCFSILLIYGGLFSV